MRIAIMGSGGVGAYVGAWLQQAGAEVIFIARGAHLAALRDQGLRIEHPQRPLALPRVAATDDPGGVGPVDHHRRRGAGQEVGRSRLRQLPLPVEVAAGEHAQVQRREIIEADPLEIAWRRAGRRAAG